MLSRERAQLLNPDKTETEAVKLQSSLEFERWMASVDSTATGIGDINVRRIFANYTSFG